LNSKCWGNVAGSYTCSSLCTPTGKFAPSNQCCTGLAWNVTSKQCYNPLQPNISITPTSLTFWI
jgi:hypothetical protein